MALKFKTTKDLKISSRVVDQVIGQEDAVRIVKKAAEQRRHVLLIGDPGTGKCVGKDTLIQLSDGSVITAENLYTRLKGGHTHHALAVNPDLTLSHSALIRAEQTTTEAWQIKTNTGKEITISNEHPFLELGTKGVRWTLTKDLRPGSYIAAARRVEHIEELQPLPDLFIQYTPTLSHTNVKEINIPSFVTEDFAEFCGYLWSEGYIARKRAITFTNSEKSLIERFTTIAQSLFGLEAHIRWFQHKHAFVATIQSSTLAKNLSVLGWGEKIPDILLQSPRAVKRAFLRAYFDGDGSATKKAFEVTTKNHLISRQLQSMLLGFDIPPIFKRVHKRATNSNMALKEYYALIISDVENLAKLCEIGFSIPRKMDRLIQLTQRKPQSNIDKIPHIGSTIFELKEALRLTAEDIGIGVHQFQRYLRGTRVPTRATVEKAIRVFAQRFVALKTICPQIRTDGSMDLTQLCSEIDLSKAALSHKTGIPVLEISSALESKDPLLRQCIFELLTQCTNHIVEEKLIGLTQLVCADVIWERIKSITPIGQQTLYDFESQGTHNFLANNIFVHNSMLGLALAELLPKEKLVDVLAFANENDENQPLIRTVPAGHGRDIVSRARVQSVGMFKNQNIIFLILALISIIIPYYLYSKKLFPFDSPIIYAASMVTSVLFLVGIAIMINMGKRMGGVKTLLPKVIVDNFGKKQAPFFDATGSHAGALLGDVLHDPFQSLFSSNTFESIDEKNAIKRVTSRELIDDLFLKYSSTIQLREEKNYEALHIPEHITLLGETRGSVSPVDVLSSSRYDYDGKMIKLTTSNNTQLIVTPEHKIAIWRNEKIDYAEARHIKEGDEVVAKSEDIILEEQDIINTYDEEHQEQCHLYHEYLETMSNNPTLGYKRIARAMGQPDHKTRWWHAEKHVPVPIQTVNWLKSRGLLPLRLGNPKLPLIAKIFGSTFGDGGIFETLNAIFLSSSNYFDTDEFAKDLQNVFGDSILLNADLREGGEFGHSWCAWNTNRNIVRFFIALGAPRGNKTQKELIVPEWVRLQTILQDEFYGSLFGGELGISQDRNTLRIEFALTGLPYLNENRIRFLTEIMNYLRSKSVIINPRGVDIRPVKSEKRTMGNNIYRFLLSQTPANSKLFSESIKINYCNMKKWKVLTAINNDYREKLHRYLDLRAKGLGAESIMKQLEISPKYLYHILNHTSIESGEIEPEL